MVKMKPKLTCDKQGYKHQYRDQAYYHKNGFKSGMLKKFPYLSNADIFQAADC